MLQLQNVYVVALVSQSTSLVVLSLLAWADRRARWLTPLAAACGLHAAAVYLMPLWRGAGHWLPHALSAAILILMLYLVHLGLQCLVLPHRRRSARIHTAICAMMLLLSALAHLSSIWCIEASETAAVILLTSTARMLWKAPMRQLRTPLRAAAALLFALAMLFLVRIPLEVLTPTSRFLLAMRETTMLLVTCMAFSFLAIYAAETRRRLHEESRMDVLTGLPNRRAMEEYAAEQIKLAARFDRPCALLMVDLDHFKSLNDTWGHSVGDQALLAAGKLFLSAAQEVNFCHVARMGGEEFAMLLSNATVDSAHAIAERLCKEIAALRLLVDEEEVRFTASVGLSTLHISETSWTGMLRRADLAMYRAKNKGRNRVMVCADLRQESQIEEETSTPFVRYG